MSDKSGGIRAAQYFSLKSELRALVEDAPDSSRELVRFYSARNSEKTGRQGRYRKGPTALYWLWRKLEVGGRRRLERKLGGASASLVSRRSGPSKLDLFLERLTDEDPGLHDHLFGQDPDSPVALLGHGDHEGLERAFKHSSDLLRSHEWRRLEDEAEARRAAVKGLPLQEVERFFSDMLELGPSQRRKVDALWREVRRDDRLTAGVHRFIRDRMKRRNDWIKTREIQRRFTKTRAEITPVLRRLSDHRLILWDQKKRAVQLNSYDPQDRRKFRWLAASTWSPFPFEPYLETGKAYSIRDFRGYVVEEWVRTGAAEFCCRPRPAESAGRKRGVDDGNQKGGGFRRPAYESRSDHITGDRNSKENIRG